MLQHDNTPSHSSFLVRDFLAKHATTVLSQLRTIQISHQLNFFSYQTWKAAVLSLLRQSGQIRYRICEAFLKKLSRNASGHWRNAGSGAYRVEGSTLKGTRLNSFKVRRENFYVIYSGIFRTDLVLYQQQDSAMDSGTLTCKFVISYLNHPLQINTYCIFSSKNTRARAPTHAHTHTNTHTQTHTHTHTRAHTHTHTHTPRDFWSRYHFVLVWFYHTLLPINVTPPPANLKYDVRSWIIFPYRP